MMRGFILQIQDLLILIHQYCTDRIVDQFQTNVLWLYSLMQYRTSIVLSVK
jgi:hypothetical protein